MLTFFTFFITGKSPMETGLVNYLYLLYIKKSIQSQTFYFT